MLNVARQIASFMKADRTLIIKSTVPVGTADQVSATAIEELQRSGKGSLKIRVVSNPEFLKEGSALADCMRPDRIIVGTADDEARSQMSELYAPFCRNHDKLMFMDNRSAELTKYAANAMLATRISFMNELANLTELLGADIEAVRKGIGSDPRIGYHFIYPGCGFGGSCFPKDLRALLHTAERAGMSLKLLRSVTDVNDHQRHILFSKLKAQFPGGLAGKSIAVWGLAFKPNTDDMREAPSRNLMEALWAEGASVQAYDPEAMSECRRIYGYRDDLHLCATRDDTLEDADALVICTEWKNFRVVDFDRLASKLRKRVIVDGRNLYSPEQVAAAGLHYSGIGLRRITPEAVRP
ncbi:UDP-glucose 6-dehydrogenase YwqF [compost metagenome]